jgi:hypothetical protein
MLSEGEPIFTGTSPIVKESVGLRESKVKKRLSEARF